MKSLEVWALIILVIFLDDKSELEGTWKSSEVVKGQRELEYVVTFTDDEFIEDYMGLTKERENGHQRRVFHFRRISTLQFNDFYFTTTFKSSHYIFQARESFLDWFNCDDSSAYNIDGSKKMDKCSIKEVLESERSELSSKYFYLIRGKTLKTNFKNHQIYLERVEYPKLLKLKNVLQGMLSEILNTLKKL